MAYSVPREGVLYERLGRIELANIRLVSLHPGSWSDDLSCTLFPIHLRGQQTPPYRALSYAWGSLSASSPCITVNGFSVQVTSNLESALRHLRHKDVRVILWVDAICINQEDVDERSNQVSQMCQIYSQATEVLIYLGDTSPNRRGIAKGGGIGPNITFTGDETDDAIVNSVATQWSNMTQKKSVKAVDVFCLVKMLSKSGSLSGTLETLSKVPNGHVSSLFEALRQMLTVRWWSRVWVVQEAIVAGNLTVMYGNVTAPWTMLVAAAALQSQEESVNYPDITLRDDLKVLGLLSRVLDLDHFRMSWRENGRGGLLSLLRRFSSREASDNRDKIYALLGLCSSSIWPDYLSKDRDVYMRVTFQILEEEISLSALTGDLGRKNKQDLPSWVPDWSWAMDEHDHERATWYSEYNSCGEASRLEFADFTLRRDYENNIVTPSPGWVPMKSWIRIGMQHLINGLNVSPSPTNLLPQPMSTVLKMYKLAHPGSEDFCNSLIALCHPGGRFESGAFTVTLSPILGTQVISGGLGMMGSYVGRVVKVMEPLYSVSSMNMVKGTITIWFENWMALSDRRSKSDLVAFASTLTSGMKVEAFGPVPLSDEDESSLLDWLLCVILERPRLLSSSGSEPPLASVTDSFTKALKISAVKRRMFLTEDWKVGLGPTSMAPLDQIYILPGGNLPFILRPVIPQREMQQQDTPQHLFSMVGDCYLHGSMKGERGPLVTCGRLVDHILEVASRTILREWKQQVLSIPSIGSLEGVESFLETPPTDIDAWEKIKATLTAVYGRLNQLDVMRELASAWGDLKKCETLKHANGLSADSVINLI